MGIELISFNIKNIPNDLKLEYFNYLNNFDRIRKFIHKSDQYRSLTSELLIRKFVSPLTTRTLPGGQLIKPTDSSGGTQFNVSHDGDFVIIGIIRNNLNNSSIGIDLSKSEKTNSEMFENLVKIFSIKEWEYIDNSVEKFFHLWTIKESFVKCIGTGLYTEPQFLEVVSVMESVESIKSQIKFNEIEIKNFKIQTFSKMIPNYVISVCIGPIGECDVSWTGLLPDQCRVTSSVVEDDYSIHFREIESFDELVS